jgi:hypothetical protein
MSQCLPVKSAKRANINNRGCNPWQEYSNVLASPKGGEYRIYAIRPLSGTRLPAVAFFRELHSRLFLFSPFGTLGKYRDMRKTINVVLSERNPFYQCDLRKQ